MKFCEAVYRFNSIYSGLKILLTGIFLLCLQSIDGFCVFVEHPEQLNPE